MHYRHLGDAGIRISAISLGGWINYGEGKVDEGIARRVVETAYEQGINFFDLADIYGKGEAEKQMGAVLSQYPRHTLVISTKVFWPMSDDVNDRGLSRKHILESIDKSLARLGTDYVDIYFCHRPDPSTPIRETVQAMHTVVESGRALYWGTSVWSADQIVEAYDLCDRYGWHLPKAEQPQYSMLHRERVEEHILPAAHRRGIGLVVFSPLGQGMLTGKYDDGIPEGSRFAREEWAKDRFVNEQNIARVKALKAVADDLGVTRADLALAWVLRHPGVSSAIIGATRPEHVLENIKAADLTLDAAAIQRIEAILKG
ncbi:MAG: aldo/keto reductase family protein [Anaerolineae bacterium]|nr:aldo/keto reductase family protein [Anaerolineae bacterium]NUQ06840.1 aldo/keto reductase family protein [Anaerolineae bacterium]